MNVCGQKLICEADRLLPADIISRKEAEVIVIDKNRLLRYSMQLAMLKQLLNKKLITEEEYNRVLRKLKKDYGVISNLTT